MKLPSSKDPESLKEELGFFLATEFWGVAREAVDIVQVKGGITNLLFRASAQGTDKFPHVLVRVFGEGGSILIDRERERIIVEQISKLGFGPRIAASYAEGRLEEFFPDKASIESTDMLKLPYRPLIASRLREMHGLAIDDDYSPGAAGIWRNLADWLRLARETTRQSPIPLDSLEEEIKWASAQISNLVNKEFATQAARDLSRIVFSHNDLLGGNILYSGTTGRLVFIDFEYSCYNYAAFDIANHFCAVPESQLIGTGIYSVEQYPSVNEQTAFLEEYLQTAGENLTEAIDLIGHFSMLAELRWIVWAVVQAEKSSVIFDYDNYAKERFNGYREMKRRLSI